MARMTAALSTALLLPKMALAHPDHLSGGAPSLSHLFLDPYHLGLALSAVALSFAMRRLWLRRKLVASRTD